MAEVIAFNGKLADSRSPAGSSPQKAQEGDFRRRAQALWRPPVAGATADVDPERVDTVQTRAEGQSPQHDRSHLVGRQEESRRAGIRSTLR
ncbi:MAG: hypothetical protein IT530_13835 [Burkholderiales bacterium]|nr:hypothetical protein [Burkholderiales bacterium]